MADQPDTSTLEPEEPQTVVDDVAAPEQAERPAPAEAPEAGEGEEPQPPKFFTDDKRADLYDKIEAKRAAKTKEFEGDTQDPELVYGRQAIEGAEETGDPTVEALEREAAAKARQFEATELHQAAGQQQPDQGQMVRVKVDGVERDVPIADIIANYQMNSAADDRLARAKDIIEQAKALQAATQARQPEDQSGTDAYQSDGQGQGDAGNSQPDQADLYDRVAEAMQLGDTHEAGQALRELVSSIATPQSSPRELAANVAFQVRLDEENRRTETALRSFVQEHEQVGRDPRLQALGIEAMDQQFVQDFRASGVSDEDIYNRTNGLNPQLIRQLHRAGRAMGVPTFRQVADILPVVYENTKAWLAQASGAMHQPAQQHAPQTSERQQRLQRVAQQPPHRAGPSARPAPPKDTVAQTVAEMRVARFGAR